MELEDLDEPGHLIVHGVISVADIPELLQAIETRRVAVLHLEDAEPVPAVKVADALRDLYSEPEGAPLHVHVRPGSRLPRLIERRPKRPRLRVVAVPIEDDR